MCECSPVEFELWCSLCEHTLLEFQIKKIELDDWMQKILYSVASLFVNIEYIFVNFNYPRFLQILILYLFSVLHCLVCAWAALSNDDVYKWFNAFLVSVISLLMYQEGPKHIWDYIIVCNGNMATLPVSAFFGLVNVCLMPGLFTVINQNTLYVINLQCTCKTFLITCNLVTCFFNNKQLCLVSFL